MMNGNQKYKYQMQAKFVNFKNYKKEKIDMQEEQQDDKKYLINYHISIFICN